MVQVDVVRDCNSMNGLNSLEGTLSLGYAVQNYETQIKLHTGGLSVKNDIIFPLTKTL